MLAAILGILPKGTRIGGSILLSGIELLGLSERQMNQIRGKEFTYIPQGSGNGLNPLLTAGFQIAEPLIEKKKLNRMQGEAEAIKWMKKLHLGNEEMVAKQFPHQLSGGMKQRVLVAMGAATESKILLADEPTKGLDHDRVKRVVTLFKELENRTLLCVSHDIGFVRETADIVCVMYAAEQVEVCTKEEFFSEPLHPYSKIMLEALPETVLHVNM